MSSIKLIFCVLKFLRFIFHGVGLLRKSQKSGKCGQYFPFLVLLLLITLHSYVRWEMETTNAELNEFQPDSRPALDIADVISVYAHNLAYILLLIWCLIKREQLWFIVDQSQIIYKDLKLLLKKSFRLKCSKQLHALSVLQILLLSLLSFKLYWINRPKVVDEFYYNHVNYLMNVMRLIYALMLTAQVFYYLLHAALLHTLNTLLQQGKLKLLSKVLPVQAKLKQVQQFAACYFSLPYLISHVMLCAQSAAFVHLLSYDENELMQQDKSLDDMEDEAEWAGKELPPTRGRLMSNVAIFLALGWHVAQMMTLLCAAHIQQREHKSLLNKLWHSDASAKSMVKTTEVSRELTSKDIFEVLLSSEVKPIDYHATSINFLAWQKKSHSACIQLNHATAGFKMLLQMLLCSSIVDFVQQTELINLQNQLKEPQ